MIRADLQGNTRMKRMFGRLLAGALMLVGPVAAAEDFSAGQQREIERIVREYLMRNPALIVEALQAAEAKMKDEQEARAKSAMTERRKDLLEDPASPVLG